jgi:atrial natriuretic peptide receptor A
MQMERYSKHLEALVAERTQELIAEQNKTTSLLYSKRYIPDSLLLFILAGCYFDPTGMLPRQVADDLKHGKPAPATQFTSATIFFRFEDLNDDNFYDH